MLVHYHVTPLSFPKGSLSLPSPFNILTFAHPNQVLQLIDPAPSYPMVSHRNETRAQQNYRLAHESNGIQEIKPAMEFAAVPGCIFIPACYVRQNKTQICNFICHKLFIFIHLGQLKSI